MMKWLIPIGLGAAVVGLVVYAKKKEDEAPKLSRVPVDNTRFRSRSPGQPQPPAYIRDLRYTGG